MPIKWKQSKSLKPSVVLDRIAEIRTVSAEGRPSFTGFVLQDALPALQSMLVFPDVAADVQKSTLMWKALAIITSELTPAAFLAAINETLKKQISTKEKHFHVLTSISINPEGLSRDVNIDGTVITLSGPQYPKKYSGRDSAILSKRLPVEASPPNYARVIVKVTAKSSYGAMTKALRALDLLRAAWCLLANSEMEIVGQEWSPINAVRLGSIHTIHNVDGSLAAEEIWFEPNFASTNPFNPGKPEVFKRNTKYILQRVKKCLYASTIIDALLRYVRGLDERDQNTAFLRLWGAFESLTSPDRADYDKVIVRSAFLFKDHNYHRQILEHLREYRNKSVHAGDQSESAKTHCFQLQIYFRSLIWFHLRNVARFRTLSEVNEFLDLPPNSTDLIRRRRLINQAIRFVS